MGKGKHGGVFNFLNNEFLSYLEDECRGFLDKVIGEVDYKNRTYNLYDSYGYGIYLDGKLQRSSFTSATPKEQKATQPKKWYGAEFFGYDLNRMLFDESGYKPSSKKGYVIIFAAMAPYAVPLEKGTYGGGDGLQRKYKVISFAYSELKSSFGKDLMNNMVSDVNAILYNPLYNK